MTTPGCNIIIHITYALKLGPVLGFEGVVLAKYYTFTVSTDTYFVCAQKCWKHSKILCHRFGRRPPAFFLWVRHCWTQRASDDDVVFTITRALSGPSDTHYMYSTHTHTHTH